MSRRVSAVLASLTLLVPAGAACAHAGQDEAGRSAEARTLDTNGPIDRVIAISVDGFNPAAIGRLGQRARGFKKLMRQGASTLNARTAVELTDTLPNHTGMVTGRRIAAASGGHGVTWNDDRLTPPTVQEAAGHDVGSVFTAVHDNGGSTGFFASKTKFSLWERSWPVAVDEDVIVENNRQLVNRFVADLAAGDRAFRFLHLSAPDKAGHARGFMSKPYLNAVASTDRLIRKVVRAIGEDPALAETTAIILTADHGGSKAHSHRNPARLVNYRIPFMIWGPGVEPGSDLYEINSTYQNPKRARTTYDDQPIRNGAVANLALSMLELPAVPDSEFDVAQDLVWSSITPPATARD